MSVQIDTTVVGHVTIDVNIIRDGIIENILGGTPTYSGFALTKLGREVGIASKIGEDFPENFPPLFSKFGLNTEGMLVCNEKTTRFKNKYLDDEKREQTCEEICEPIFPEDIPEVYLNADGFYISPVLNEVPYETVKKISENAQGTIMFDPQGLFRNISNSGEISLEKPDDLDRYMSHVDIAKIGLDELDVFEDSPENVLRKISNMGPEIVIFTRGGRDSKMLTSEGEIIEVESIDVEPKDLTGAGDVFGGTFLHNYLKKKDPEKALRFANVAAGLKIEYKGPTGFPTEDDIYEVLNRAS